MTRVLRLLTLQIRTSLQLLVQYRVDFFVDSLIGLLWTAAAVVPLFVVYGDERHPHIPGWSFGESLLVVGCFLALQGIINGAISPSLQLVVEQVRSGTLDFVLLKPVDAQFLVSTSRFQPWQLSALLHAGLVFGLAFHSMGRWPPWWGIPVALVLLTLSTWMLYSLWIMIVSTAFFVVKADNLSYLFSSIFDAGRWPSSVFRGVVRIVFTFVVPLTVMTTFPAEALRGRLTVLDFFGAVAATLAIAGLARWVWRSSLARYTSAGG